MPDRTSSAAYSCGDCGASRTYAKEGDGCNCGSTFSAAQDHAETIRRVIDRPRTPDLRRLTRAEVNEGLAALAALVDELERLREQVNSGRTGRERAEGLPEGTLPRV